MMVAHLLEAMHGTSGDRRLIKTLQSISSRHGKCFPRPLSTGLARAIARPLQQKASTAVVTCDIAMTQKKRGKGPAISNAFESERPVFRITCQNMLRGPAGEELLPSASRASPNRLGMESGLCFSLGRTIDRDRVGMTRPTMLQPMLRRPEAVIASPLASLARR
jgi:hypothetical protein